MPVGQAVKRRSRQDCYTSHKHTFNTLNIRIVPCPVQEADHVQIPCLSIAYRREIKMLLLGAGESGKR